VPTSLSETALFDEPAALPDDRSSVTLEDEEFVDPSTTEENPRVEQPSRSNTLSSGVAKRGIDEVEVDGGDDGEVAEGSPGSSHSDSHILVLTLVRPGSKRARAT
jgi:hypothetical protein